MNPGPATPLLGGLMLLCAFALLWQPRVAPMIALYRAQALALAAAALWQGYARGSGSLCLTGLLVLAIDAIALPVALRRMAARHGLAHTPAPPAGRAMALGAGRAMALGAGRAMALGAALIGLAVLAAPRLAMTASSMRETVTFSLGLILLGLATVTTRRQMPAQAIGLLSAANGLVLAAVGMSLPFVAGLPVALALLLAVPGLLLARCGGDIAWGR